MTEHAVLKPDTGCSLPHFMDNNSICSTVASKQGSKEFYVLYLALAAAITELCLEASSAGISISFRQ